MKTGFAFALTLGTALGSIPSSPVSPPRHRAPTLRYVTRVDSQALQRMRNAASILSRASALRATIRTEFTAGQFATSSNTIDSVRYMRPGYVWRFEQVERPSVVLNGDSAPRFVVRRTVCTPTTSITSFQDGWAVQFPSRNEAACVGFEDELLMEVMNNPHSPTLLHAAIWDTTGKTLDPLVRSVARVGRETWRGTAYDVIEWVYEGAYTMPTDTTVFTTRVYLDSADHIGRVITTDTRGNRRDQQLLSLDVDPPLTAGDFAWTAPSGTRLERQVPRKAAVRRNYVGTTFPNIDLTVPFLDGSRSTLRAYFARHKGTLIWYWNTRCGHCMMEFPHLEQMYRALQSRGIGVVALDLLPDDTTEGKVYRDFHGTTMPVVLDTTVTRPLWSEMGPFLVIDSAGTIVDAMEEVDYRRLYLGLEALAAPAVPAAGDVAAQISFDNSYDARKLLDGITLTPAQRGTAGALNRAYRDAAYVTGYATDYALRMVAARRRQIALRAMLTEPQQKTFDANVAKIVAANAPY